jgi:hypothetical protein
MELIMQRTILALIVLLGLAPAARAAVDDPVITLTGPADVANRRGALINLMYGVNSLPTLQAVVTQGVPNPYGYTLPNVARVDQYVASMSNGQTNTSNLYVASSPNNRRVVILNMGHQGTCSWPSFAAQYGTTAMMQGLLSAGYSIFAMNMPACGDSNGHIALFASYGTTAMQYFLEPAIQAMNYWDARKSFSRYDYVGLSGGGWTGVVLAAVDPRITVSVLVSGSMPGVEFCCWANPSGNQQDNSDGGSEGSSTPFYTVAGYLDQYLMGAFGTNRREVQVLNAGDDCCFGPAQWTPTYAASHGGVDWWSYLVSYWSTLAAAQPSMTPSRYVLLIDRTSTTHQISAWSQGIAMNVLANATGGRHR